MRISNRLACLLRERKPALGFWINLSDPAIAEIAALAGYDWVLIDTEHNPLTEAHVQGLLYAVNGSDVTGMVRVRANREEHVKWVLDAGAGGVIIPSVEDAADARHAVEICKYHPLGRRGYGPNHASGFWSRTTEYLANANRDILLICQIELASAVAEVEEICQIEGIDGIWIGPTDLAQSLGHLGDPAHPDVRAAVDKVIETANALGKPWGIPVGTLPDLERYIGRGGQVMVMGSDTRMLRVGTTEIVNGARAILEKKAAAS